MNEYGEAYARNRPRIYDRLADNDVPNLLAAVQKLAEVRGISEHEAAWAAVELIHRAAAEEAS